MAPYQIEGNGALRLAPGGNVGTADGSSALLLGAAFNPDQPIIYVGIPALNEVAVFTYAKSGQLAYVGAATTPLGGGATCWDSTNGRYLYVTDTVTDSVSVFSLANPLQPVQIQQFALAGPQAPPGSPPGTIESDTYQVALSPNGQTLYVVDHDFGSPTLSFADGNQLHVLSVAANGMLSEPNAPVLLDSAGASPAMPSRRASRWSLAEVAREASGSRVVAERFSF